MISSDLLINDDNMDIKISVVVVLVKRTLVLVLKNVLLLKF